MNIVSKLLPKSMQTLPQAECKLINIEDMMEFLRERGEPKITTINSRWWCYFKFRKGAVEIQIDGDRKDNGSLYEAVASCYAEVKKVFK